MTFPVGLDGRHAGWESISQPIARRSPGTFVTANGHGLLDPPIPGIVRPRTFQMVTKQDEQSGDMTVPEVKQFGFRVREEASRVCHERHRGIMKLLALTPLGRNREISRLWIETRRLEALGFPPGMPFSVEAKAEELVLKPVILAENHVSSRATPGGRRPIIDLANQSMLQNLLDYPELKITPV